MIGRNEFLGHPIRTAEGRRIYKAGIEREGQLQLAASKAKTKKEEARLLAEGRRMSADALAKALALNPAPKKRKAKR